MIIQTFTGTPFQCGEKTGSFFKSQIAWRLKHNKITTKSTEKHLQALQKLRTTLNKNYHFIIQEIEGLASGSERTVEEILLLNYPELRQYHHGCSSIAVVEKNKVILAHNEDGDQEEKKNTCALIHYTFPENSFSAYTYLGELPGNAYGWNKERLFFTVNYIKIKKIDWNGLPSFVIARLLLEAKSIEEVINILTRIKSASAFHYFIGKGKRIISVEQIHKRVSIKEVKGIMTHTNHFLHGAFDNESVCYIGSRKRFQRLQELLPTEDLIKVLFDGKKRPYPLYAQTGDKNRTLSTVVFDGINRKVIIFQNRKMSEKITSRLL